VEGETLPYTCKAGFGGTVVATCGGNGTFRVDGECKLQCENVHEFLDVEFGKHWPEIYDKKEELDLTESGAKDVIRFGCKRGRVGKPWAVCFEGKWSLHGSCKSFQTIGGCSCKVKWDACKDLWGSDCQHWYGCYDPGKPGSSSWCEVNMSAGCGGREEPPTWDYCVAGHANAEWPEEKVPARGPYKRVQMGLMAGALLLLIVAAYLMRCGYQRAACL